MHSKQKKIFAIVGMPGSGKTEVTRIFQEKGLPFVRFGEETDRALKEAGLQLTEQNERAYREKLRLKLGMAAYAIKAKPKIAKLVKEHEVVILDGLYSWEEYQYLKSEFPNLELICVIAEPPVRYARLARRSIRSLSGEEARQRDIDEIEKLSKGGPIAIADYCIDNNGTIEKLKDNVVALLQRLAIA